MKHSVMPHIWPTTPPSSRSSRAAARSRGQVEPEMVALRTDDRSRPSKAPDCRQEATCAGATNSWLGRPRSIASARASGVNCAIKSWVPPASSAKLMMQMPNAWVNGAPDRKTSSEVRS